MRVSPEQTVLAGRYRLGERLGVGGMAEVFDGFDERLHRPVAVKLLKPAMAAQPEVRGRFEDEARAAARLTHPNVVAVYDTGEDGGAPFIVMERLPGETLAARLASGPVDPRWLRRVAGDVLQALQAAHGAGIVHRDIKPGNVLIAADGCAKVADFGIAKSMEGTAAITGANLVIGTPAYLAPERLDGQPATVRSDLYSLGVVLYEALTGTKPPPVVWGALAGAPADLVSAVRRAMATDPADRFASAADMAAVLRRRDPPAATVDATVEARLAPAGGDATRVLEVGHRAPEAVPRRLRRWPIAAVILGLTVVGFLALVLGSSTSSSTAPPEDPLAHSIRAVADGVSRSDGPGWTEAAAQLDAVADAVAGGGGTVEADALLSQLGQWRAGGGLTPAAVNRISAVLLNVPGVDPARLVPTTTTTETTAVVRGEGRKGRGHKGGD